jgi:hypothetical protein
VSALRKWGTRRNWSRLPALFAVGTSPHKLGRPCRAVCQATNFAINWRASSHHLSSLDGIHDLGIGCANDPRGRGFIARSVHRPGSRQLPAPRSKQVSSMRFNYAIPPCFDDLRRLQQCGCHGLEGYGTPQRDPTFRPVAAEKPDQTRLARLRHNRERRLAKA